MTLRRTILDNITAGLNDITVANGFAVDLIATEALQVSVMGGETDQTRNRAFVLCSGESWDIRAMTGWVRARLSVQIDVIPEGVEDTVPIFDHVDVLCAAVQTKLAELGEADPAWGVQGTEDYDLRWQLAEFDGRRVPGVSIQLDINYRHDRLNPASYG